MRSPGGGGLREALNRKGDQVERRAATPEQTAVKEKKELRGKPSRILRKQGRRLPSSPSGKVTTKGPCGGEKLTLGDAPKLGSLPIN